MDGNARRTGVYVIDVSGIHLTSINASPHFMLTVQCATITHNAAQTTVFTTDVYEILST